MLLVCLLAVGCELLLSSDMKETSPQIRALKMLPLAFAVSGATFQLLHPKEVRPPGSAVLRTLLTTLQI